MKKILYTAGIALIGLTACKPKPETVYQEVDALHASDVYNNDSVYTFIEKNKDKYADLANSYLKKSKEAEGKDVNMAVYYSKRAVTLDPTLANYKSLAALLDKTTNYKELAELYGTLTQSFSVETADGKYEAHYLFGPPDEEEYTQYLVSELLAYGALYAQDVYPVTDLGFDLSKMKEQIFSDKRVKVDMTTEAGKNMLLLFLTEEELEAYSNLPGTFKDFLATIEDAAPVFEINKDNVHQFHYDQFNGSEDFDGEEGPTVSYIYASFLKEKRDHKDGWYKYNFNHVIHINDSVTAVVYAIDSSELACPIEMRHIYHRLVVYNNKAKIISSQIVANQSGNELLTASFNFNKFTTTEYKRSWKKRYDKMDFDNYITGTEKVKDASYEIGNDGKIVAD